MPSSQLTAARNSTADLAARAFGERPTLGDRLASIERRLAALEAKSAVPEAVIELAGTLSEMRSDIRSLQDGKPKRPRRGYATLKEAVPYASGFGLESIRLWVRAGAVGGYRAGNRWFVEIASLQGFVARKGFWNLGANSKKKSGRMTP